jgi:hypothetical protein
MKRTIAVMTFLIFMISNIQAGNMPKIETLSDKSISVFFESWNRKGLILQIRNETGDNVFVDRIKNSKTIGKTYNLKNLEAGNYTLILRNETSIMKTPFTVDIREVSFESTNSNTFHNPTISVIDNKLELNLLSLNRDVNILIENAQGEVIFQEANPKARNVQKVYNLNKLETGIYTMVIKQEGHLSRKTFEISH